MTNEEIKELVKKADLKLHPYIYFCSPLAYKMVKEDYPDFNEKYFIETPYLDEYTILQVERDKLDIENFIFNDSENIFTNFELKMQKSYLDFKNSGI